MALRAARIGIGFAVLTAAVLAQAPASTGPSFTVASIKLNTSGGSRGYNQIQPGGRYTATNYSLVELIRSAYRLQGGFQLIGGPNWLRADRFDIVAKSDSDLFSTDLLSAAPRPLELALRALLADRFAFVAHRETRQLPIYQLVSGRSDGRIGPNLTRSDTDCAALVVAARGDAPLPGLGRGASPCSAAASAGRFTGHDLELPLFASFLGNTMDTVVIDRTGLTGAFNIDLTWQSDQPPSSQPASASVPDAAAPSLFTAVQEQLGLKLEPARGPVEVLVIDHVEHPAED